MMIYKNHPSTPLSITNGVLSLPAFAPVPYKIPPVPTFPTISMNLVHLNAFSTPTVNKVIRIRRNPNSSPNQPYSFGVITTHSNSPGYSKSAIKHPRTFLPCTAHESTLKYPISDTSIQPMPCTIALRPKLKWFMMPGHTITTPFLTS